MGFHICWVAVRGKPKKDVYSGFRLAATEEIEELPESPLVGATLLGGWTLLFANDPEELPILEPAPLRKHSIGCDLVACLVEEYSMISASVQFCDGEELWWLAYDSSKGLEDLKVRGTLPSQSGPIRDRHLQMQKAATTNVDYVFDIPIEIAKSIVGFRHDEENGDVTFTVLEMVA